MYSWVLFIVLSIVLVATPRLGLEEIAVSSVIKEHPSLLRLTRDAVRDPKVERESNHLLEELTKGNLEAGLGKPGHISGTGVFYFQGHNGAKLYFRKVGENSYEIVAKSAKGKTKIE